MRAVDRRERRLIDVAAHAGRPEEGRDGGVVREGGDGLVELQRDAQVREAEDFDRIW